MSKTIRDKHSKLDLAYIGGWIDGEGSIFITKTKNKKSGSWQHILCVATVNTNKEIIEWFYQKFSASKMICSWKSKKFPQYQIAYQWIITGRMAGKFLKLIIPYLKVKKQQAISGIEFQDKKTKNSNETKGIKLTEKELEWRERYYEKMSKLNHSKYYSQSQRLSEETS